MHIRSTLYPSCRNMLSCMANQIETAMPSKINIYCNITMPTMVLHKTWHFISIIFMLGALVWLILNFDQPSFDTQRETVNKSRDCELVSNDPGPKKTNGTTTAVIITWNGLGEVKKLVHSHFFDPRNMFCDRVFDIRKNDSALPILVNISFGCEEAYENGFGSGNYLSFFYHLRMTALALENIDLHITCFDADAVKSKLVLPWFMGHFLAKPNSQHWLGLSPSRACVNYHQSPMSLMYRSMQYDLRRMAIGMVGIPSADHPAAKFAEQYLWSNNALNTPDSDLQLALPQKHDIPVFPSNSIELDDATLHFRCGDLMSRPIKIFGFMKFSSFTKHISKEARSIGIVTQPFDPGTQIRTVDQGSTGKERCRIVTLSMVDYIQQHFPNSRVSIRNGPNETIALAFTRLVMSNQTVIAISSFGVFPGIGTFGTGFLREPHPRRRVREVNEFLIQPRLDIMADNIVLIDEPNIISPDSMFELWNTKGADGALEWFWNDTIIV